MKTTIKFPKSDSFAFFVTINKISKALDNAFFTVKENPDEEPVLQKKLGAGISLSDSRLYKNQLSYKVQIDGADTQFMEVGVRYFFDVKGTIGNAQKTFLWGELILSDTETGYLNPAMQGDTVAVAQVYTATFETGAQSEYVETEVDPVATAKIGDMTKLNTTAKDTLVKAINEVKKAADDAETPLFTEATARENIESGEKQPTLWGKVKTWFSSLKALAFKDKVGTSDFEAGAKCPNATNAVNATNTDFTNGTPIVTFEEKKSSVVVAANGIYFVEAVGVCSGCLVHTVLFGSRTFEYSAVSGSAGNLTIDTYKYAMSKNNDGTYTISCSSEIYMYSASGGASTPTVGSPYIQVTRIR